MIISAFIAVYLQKSTELNNYSITLSDSNIRRYFLISITFIYKY